MESKSIADANNTAFKKPGATILVVLVLSLVTWYFFYLESMPLTPADTIFVVGGWVVVVLIAKWLLVRLHRTAPRG